MIMGWSNECRMLNRCNRYVENQPAMRLKERWIESVKERSEFDRSDKQDA